MKESDLQSLIIKYLTKLGAYVTNIMVTSKSGTHDLLVCYRGKFYSIEVKVGKNKPSPLQLAHKDMVEEAGGVAMIVWSLAEVKDYFKTLPNE